MTDIVRFRCNNCGHRFKTEGLSEGEHREVLRRNRPTSPVHCPKCRRTDIRRDWE